MGGEVIIKRDFFSKNAMFNDKIFYPNTEQNKHNFY